MPGNYVAARYLENGHVTRIESFIGPTGTQIGKPGSAGLVYIYGTINTANQPLLDVFKWGANNTLAEGRLLAINTFDDGRCYQISNSPDFAIRAAEFPNPVQGQPNSQHELWCEVNFQIPQDVQEGSLTLYWVWQWPTMPNMDPGDPAGKDEIYTTCADIQVTKNPSVVAAAKPGQSDPAQDPMPSAVSNFKERAANVTLPTDKNFYGPNNPGGYAGNAASSSGAPPAPSTQPLASTPAPAPPAPSSSSSSSSSIAPSPAPVTVTVTTTVTPSPTAANCPPSNLPPFASGAHGFPPGGSVFTSYAYIYTTTTTDVVVTLTPTAASRVGRRHVRDFE
jgi:hypothetical protein